MDSNDHTQPDSDSISSTWDKSWDGKWRSTFTKDASAPPPKLLFTAKDKNAEAAAALYNQMPFGENALEATLPPSSQVEQITYLGKLPVKEIHHGIFFDEATQSYLIELMPQASKRKPIAALVNSLSEIAAQATSQTIGKRQFMKLSVPDNDEAKACMESLIHRYIATAKDSETPAR